MKKTDVLWDRLAGGVQIYVENYIISQHAAGRYPVKPSYPVDYKIDDIEEITADTSLDGYFAHKISRCRDASELPIYLKKLVKQYLPRFFDAYPEYRGEKSLEKFYAD